MHQPPTGFDAAGPALGPARALGPEPDRKV
jgi:hypothetical protein